MTTSRDGDGDIVRDLVPSWLRSANLGYAIPNFEMAGIVTPRSLADLELRYFGPLGVTDGDDRKRLFYLVQRVRGELRREEEEEEEEEMEEVDDYEEKKAKAAKAVAVAAVVRDLGRDKEMERRAGEEDNDYDDDYADDDDAFQSPSRSDFDSRDRGELTSTVVLATMTTARGIRDGGMDVISPVTMSSPLLASDDDHKRRLDRHHRHNHHHDDVGGDDDGGIVVSAAGIESSPFQASGRVRHSHLDHRGGNNDGGGGGKTAGTGAGTPAASAGQVSSPASASATAAAATGGATGGGRMTAREQLARELEVRAERRREQKMLMTEERKERRGRWSDDADGDGDDDDAGNGSQRRRGGGGGRRRRQSFLPSASNNPVPADAEFGRAGGGGATRTTTTTTTTTTTGGGGTRPPSRPSSIFDAPHYHHRPPASAATAATAHAGMAGASAAATTTSSSKMSNDPDDDDVDRHHRYHHRDGEDYGTEDFPPSSCHRRDDGDGYLRETMKQSNASTTAAAVRAGGGSTGSGSAVATAAKAKDRFYHSVGDDAGSAMSDTSDLSASVFSSNRSSVGVTSRSSGGGGGGGGGRRRSSIPSASVVGPAVASHRSSSSSSSLSGRISSNIAALGGLLGRGNDAGIVAGGVDGGGRTDENKNSGNFDEKWTRTMPTRKNGGPLVRDGKKRLSTIPSSAIAPLSPLAGFSSTRLDRSITSSLSAAAAAASSSSVGPSNPLRRGSRSSLGGASGSDSVGRGGRSVTSSISRPGTAATSESKKDRHVNLKSNGVRGIGIGIPPGATTTSGSSSLSRPSSRSSVDGLQRFDVYGRTNASPPPSVEKARSLGDTSASVASVKRQRKRPKSPVPPTISHSSAGGGGGGSVRSRQLQQRMSPLSSRGGGRATSPTRSVSSARSNGAVLPKSTTQEQRSHHDHDSLSPPKMGVANGHNKCGPLYPARSPTRSRTPPPAAGFGGSNKGSISVGNGNSAAGGAVFVHGALEDTSWSSQIGRLRDSFDHEHARYLTSTARLRRQHQNEEDDAEYEMRIRVIVRKRPMSNRESSGGSDVDAVQPLDYDDYGKVLVHQPKTKLDMTKEVETTSFAFDNVFDEKANNVGIYERSLKSLIPGVFRGKWASVFAYGQTGSGKTFTMMGSNATGLRAGNQAENSVNRANLGLYCLAAQDVFRIAEDPAYANIAIGVSLFEIYGGKLLDLLNARSPVRCLEDSHGKVCFPGLSEHPVSSAEELMDIIDAGALNRSTGTTSANADSSRSHAVLQLSLRKDVGRTKNKEHGRLTFIDLAGSERGVDTSMACRTTRMEGAEINTSLLALKEVIRALATGGSLKRIPFRGSKLTQVLKESFVGKNSRTVMVACVAPNMKNVDHSLNTLRYADRVKERDAQTGELSASVAASSKIKRDQVDDMARVQLPPPRPLTAPAASFRIVREEVWFDDEAIPPPPSKEELLIQSFDESKLVDDDEYSDADADKTDNSEIDVDETVDSLEEALKSHDTISLPHVESTIPIPSSRRDNPSAQSLIATHKSIMSKLLQMLQHEMTLVNDTDANRDNIDEYMKELEQLSDQQLSLLSTLRESLVSYKSLFPSTNDIHGAKAILHDPSDNDDSFDLRD